MLTENLSTPSNRKDCGGVVLANILETVGIPLDRSEAYSHRVCNPCGKKIRNLGNLPSRSTPTHFCPFLCSPQARSFAHSLARPLVWSLRLEKERRQLLRRIHFNLEGRVLNKLQRFWLQGKLFKNSLVPLSNLLLTSCFILNLKRTLAQPGGTFIVISVILGLRKFNLVSEFNLHVKLNFTRTAPVAKKLRRKENWTFLLLMAIFCESLFACFCIASYALFLVLRRPW